MPDPLDWALAERIGRRLAGEDPFAGSYHASSLEWDFHELTAEAEALVTAETGLVPVGPGRAQVVDRAGWIRTNVVVLERLLAPVADRLADRLSGPGAPVAAHLAGIEVGTPRCVDRAGRVGHRRHLGW